MQRQSLATLFLLALALPPGACGSGQNDPGGTGGAPAAGGGAGGKAGAGAGGNATGGAGGGSGGAAGGGGVIGSGGISADGGAGAGGAPAGGASGSGGAPADTGPAPDRDTASDVSAPPVSGDKFLDQCFEGLRPLQGWFIRTSKRSADGKVQFRMAVETADRFGTSGTSPFAMVRFAIVADGKTACLTSPPAGAYKVTHHNCKDTATITVDDRRYEISDPVSLVTPISAFAGATQLWGPLPLSETSCTAGRSTPASEMKCAHGEKSDCP
jgi:hypothetical protein